MYKKTQNGRSDQKHNDEKCKRNCRKKLCFNVIAKWSRKWNITNYSGVRGGVVGWGTALQAGKSRVWFPMVSLELFIDIILPAALWPWGRLNLDRNEYQEYFLWGKGDRCLGLTHYHLHVRTVLKSGSLNLLERDYFVFRTTASLLSDINIQRFQHIGLLTYHFNR